MDIEKAANKVPEAARCIIVSGQLNKGKTITFESIESFLANNGRKTVHMKLDGNCLKVHPAVMKDSVSDS